MDVVGTQVTVVFKDHEKFELSDFEVFSRTEIKIMFTEKNIAFTCIFKEK